jgi:transposase, IS30 family
VARRYGRPKVPAEVRCRFWERVRQGASVPEAAAEVGVSRRTGNGWFREAGGVVPRIVEQPTGFRLTLQEREEIAWLVAAGHGVRSIARDLGRAPSTISRELRREAARSRRGYRASTAQGEADARARRPKQAKLATCLRLRREVQDRLERNHSPEQIARRLVDEFPDDAEMRVSHETIYQSIYVQGRGGLKRELARHLRTGRALRKPHRKQAERRGRIPGMVNISERPPEVQDRAVPGHWEGDLIVGKDSASAIGTLVERTTRFTMLLHLPADHGAVAVQEAIVAKMGQLPDLLRQSLTWDQGAEMANHVQIAAQADLEIYFCDPRSPWQRGSNENTNGLLRQYFAKATDLSMHGPGYLDFVATELNNRPRKTLDWKTPAEALDQLLSQPSQPPGVALTG